VSLSVLVLRFCALKLNFRISAFCKHDFNVCKFTYDNRNKTATTKTCEQELDSIDMSINVKRSKDKITRVILMLELPNADATGLM